MKVLTFSNINWFCFWDEELLPTGVFRRLQIYCQSKKYFSLAKYAKDDQVISYDDSDKKKLLTKNGLKLNIMIALFVGNNLYIYLCAFMYINKKWGSSEI